MNRRNRRLLLLTSSSPLGGEEVNTRLSLISHRDDIKHASSWRRETWSLPLVVTRIHYWHGETDTTHEPGDGEAIDGLQIAPVS